MFVRSVLAALLGGLSCLPAVVRAGEERVTLELTVEAGKAPRKGTPVRVEVTLPDSLAGGDVRLTAADGSPVAAQLAPPALLDADAKPPEGRARRVLWFVLPELTADASTKLTAVIGPKQPQDAEKAPLFRWRPVEGKHVDLTLRGRPVARYMLEAYAYDKDDANRRDLNNKPFHHLFDPKGKRLVTKGTGGFYTHHQGLFYGFTRCTLADGSKANLWYCHDGEHQLHRRTLEELAGDVLARHRAAIDWNDAKGQTFCSEVRELAAFDVPGGTLVEWSSRLNSVRGEVTLDGDPQHAGFQFRADNEVNDRVKEKLTAYLRPDGRGQPGETRNWPEDKRMTDLPWNGMSFVLGEQRYSAAYLDSPRNPKPSFYSERDYGRFGSWFGKQTLKEGGPAVDITYRIWLQEGEMTADRANALSRDFAEPPRVTVAVK